MKWLKKIFHMEKDPQIITIDSKGRLINQHEEVVFPPNNWDFLPAGDAGLTRKVTSKGIYWRVQVKKGRRTFSKGIWAPSEIIANARAEVETVRQTDAYQKKQEYVTLRRDKKQSEYKAEFCRAVEAFLNFHKIHKSTEKIIARAVTSHAIPIGSGTVARTSMIPIEERASRAVIAWMRHNTTAYDHLHIKRIKGERKKVRQLFAGHSVAILNKYRMGLAPEKECPLQRAVTKIKDELVSGHGWVFG
jgi:hypothetical protein